MTKILRNHIIYEFTGVCYENPDLYHERHDKRSRWVVASAAIYPQPGIIVAAVLVWIYGLADMVIFAKPYKKIE